MADVGVISEATASLGLIVRGHWQSILAWAAVWTCLWMFLKLFLATLWPSGIAELRKRDRKDADKQRAANEQRVKEGKKALPVKEHQKETYIPTTITAIVFAVFVSQGCLRVLLWPDESFASDLIYGYSPRSEFYFTVACGYFVWDLVVVVVEGWDYAFYVHAIFVFLVYFFSLHPFLHYHGVIFLLFELSTPFMHLRWICIQTGNSKGVIFKLIEYTFASMFFLARLAVGWPASFFWWGHMLGLLNNGTAHSRIVVCIYLLANLVLNALNGFWFYKIIGVALFPPEKGQGGGGYQDEHTADLSDDDDEPAAAAGKKPKQT